MTVLQVDVIVTATAEGWPVEVRGVPGAAPFTMKPLGDAAIPAATGGLSAAAITKTLRDLRDGAAPATAVVELGRYLFNALLAPWWEALKALLATQAPRPIAVELALQLDGAGRLAGLPWELMHSDTDFLARGYMVAGSLVDLVVTRRTTRAQVAAEPLAHPLRYLFVIGDELDDSLRPGAECMGLLRQIGPQIQDRIVLLRTATRALGDVIEEFRPHVVHFICHGIVADGGEVMLELYDAIEQRLRPTPASELVEALVRKGGAAPWCPAAVVMSACSSGTRLAAAGQGDLAAALVAAGIPVVIGMSAEIGDLACRLFTRKFGAGVVGGTPLVVAAARGRRAALRDPEMPADSFDWGLINVVIGADLRAEAIEIPTADGDPIAQGILQRIERYSLAVDRRSDSRTLPPFCGRSDVVAAFYELMAGRGQPVLCLRSQQPSSPDNKVGKRRTLSELAAVALRAGWVPVIAMPRKEGERGLPRSVRDLAVELAFAIRKARTAHGLATPALLVDAPLAGAGPVSAAAIRDALAGDLIALRDDVRNKHDFIAQRNGEVVVLVNDVHLFGDAVKPWFLDLLDGLGLGLDQRIPVVMTYTMTTRDQVNQLQIGHDQMVEELVTRTELHRFRDMKLAPLSGHEEVLAYQRLLLHPFRTEPDYAARRYFLDLRATNGQKDELDRVLRFLHNGSGSGYPGAFFTESFLLWLKEAIQLNTAIRVARDDDILRAGGVA